MDLSLCVLADKSGTIYEAMLNIVNGRSRRIIYAVNNICAIDKVKGIDHGVVRSTENGRGSHIKVESLENWVAHSETDVKQDFSIEDDAEQLHREYLSAVESGNMETAQRMVDEAARCAGYTIHAYHRTTNRQEKSTWNAKRREWDTEYSKIMVFKRHIRSNQGISFIAIWIMQADTLAVYTLLTLNIKICQETKLNYFKLASYVYSLNDCRSAAALGHRSPIQYKTELGFVWLCCLASIFS